MYFVSGLLLVLSLTLAGCEDMGDDLSPSGRDERGTVEVGVAGNRTGQTATDFTLSDTHSVDVNLFQELAAADAVVLYFTMWCPVCDSHMTHMNSRVIADFPNVHFFAIDYVTGTVANARRAQVSGGYSNARFGVLVDPGQQVMDRYNGTMGTTIVIDSAGVIRMNEDYKDGSALRRVLEGL